MTPHHKNKLLFLLPLILTGCMQGVDDQRIIVPSDREIADPKPTQRDFVGINRQHQVIVSVVDTGVDYNHPELQKNIHFELDAQGQPVGFGKDMLTGDSYASPYLVRTSIYDSSLESEARDAAWKAYNQVSQTLADVPELAQWVNPKRAVGAEQNEGTYHGTHVAGLASYDNAAIGLTAVRVLPSQHNPQKEFDYLDEQMNQIADSIDESAKRGARVVNMSLGMDFQKKSNDPQSKAGLEFAKLTTYFNMMTERVKKYPNVLFVFAAGNGGSWKDSLNRFGMPCGVKAPNVLCVGALQENGDPTFFTDLVLNGADVVFALGDHVLSTIPTQMCIEGAMGQIEGGLFGALSKDEAKALAESCKKEKAMARLSGTSMASPIVAHKAAEMILENPHMPPSEVIKAMKRGSSAGFIGNLPIYRLKIKKPSWYATYTDRLSLTANSEVNASVDPGSWDLYVPGGQE